MKKPKITITTEDIKRVNNSFLYSDFSNEIDSLYDKIRGNTELPASPYIDFLERNIIRTYFMQTDTYEYLLDNMEEFICYIKNMGNQRN